VRTRCATVLVLLGTLLVLGACAPTAAPAARYIRASSLAREFKMRVRHDPLTGRLVLRGQTASGPVEAVVSPGLREARVNDRQYRLSLPSRYYGSDVLVDSALRRAIRSAMSAERPTHRLRSVVHKVVLDPGHGGKDPGAIGPRGVREKEVNLGVALELARILRSRGVEVVLTRSTDVFIPLEERSRIANREQPDLFISIHADAARGSSAAGSTAYVVEEEFRHGGQVYTLSDRASLAARKATLNVTHVGSAAPTGSVLLALWQVMLQEYRRESQQAAEAIQRRLPTATGQPDRGVREARYSVLKWTYAPAVLIEVGFLSNPVWEARLADPDFRRQTAQAIADAVSDFDRGLVAAEVAP